MHLASEWQRAISKQNKMIRVTASNGEFICISDIIMSIMQIFRIITKHTLI